MKPTVPKLNLRDEILVAADQLYQHYGYKKTTVEDIACAAKISRATIYLYFHSKEEIALAWSAMRNDLRCERIRAIAMSDGTPVDRIREMLHARVLFSFDNAQKFTQSLDDLFAALRLALLEQRRHTHEKEGNTFRQVLEEGCANGTFDCVDTMTAARSLILATNALLPYSLSAKQLGERETVESVIDAIADLVMTGLLTRKAEAHEMGGR